MAPDYPRKRRLRQPLAPRQRRELARLLAVLAAGPARQEKSASKLSRALDWASGHFNLLASAAALLVFLGACVIFHVSPLHPLHKIANEQGEYKRQEDKEKFIKTVVARRLEMGCELLNEGLYEPAKEEFNKALNLDKDSLPAELGILKSEVYNLLQGEWNPALIEKRVKVIEKYCEKLKKPDVPEDPHVLVFKGDINYRDDNTDEAIRCFQKAVKIDPNVSQAYFKLGFLHKKKGDQALALGLLHEKKGDQAVALRLFQENSSEQALALYNYQKAVEKSKWNTRYRDNLACQYAQMKDHENAIKHYTKAIHLEPDFIPPYLELSDVLRQNGKFKEASKCQERAVLLLEDQRVAASPKNQGGWIFSCDLLPGKVKLYEIPEKQAYAYLSLALTLHLFDKKPEALEALHYLKKARSLKLKTMSQVLSVVRQDYAHLPDQIKKKSDFCEILKREIPAPE